MRNGKGCVFCSVKSLTWRRSDREGDMTNQCLAFRNLPPRSIISLPQFTGPNSHAPLRKDRDVQAYCVPKKLRTERKMAVSSFNNCHCGSGNGIYF